MSNNLNTETNSGNDITLKDVFLKIGGFWKELYRNKWTVVGAAFLFASLFLLKSFFKEKTYTASMKFMIEEQTAAGGALGGVASILGQFGFGGRMRGGQHNLEKVLELARSQKIMDEVLLDSVTHNGNTDFLINHFINLYDLREQWEEDTLLNDINFTHKNIALFRNQENAVLGMIAAMLVGNPEMGVEGLLTIGYGETTGIFYINSRLIDEALAIILTKTLYEKLSEFYVRESTEKQQHTVNLLQTKVDSVLTELGNTEKKLAYLNDKSEGLFRRKDQVYKDQLSRNVQVLTLLYGEVLKNKEASAFLLENKTPFFQTISVPRSPLLSSRNSKIKAILIGSVLGGFLAAVFLIGRKIFREIME